MERFGVALVIPAWNEARTISVVVNGTKRFGEVIVVDDASTDETANLAAKAGALVIRQVCNRGYDSSIALGLGKALELNYAYAITMDADGQHQEDDIPHFISALEAGYDLVIGTRAKPARFGERLFRVVGKRLWGLDDILCGLKAYRLEWLGKYERCYTYESIGTELSLRMVRDGAKLCQLSVNINPRLDNPRFGGIIKANYKIIRCLIVSIIKYKFYSSE